MNKSGGAEGIPRRINPVKTESPGAFIASNEEVTPGILPIESVTTSATSSGEATTPVFALVYKPTDRVSLYANYAEALQPGERPARLDRQDMDKLTSEFMTFVLSKQGQEIVIKDGYFPLPADAAAEGRASLKFYSAE